ncbi:MAG: c-type cytochrome [Betaproteobacteria bacterium]|nr:c-type cytochrome [Betaproteobacteria bacterium]
MRNILIAAGAAGGIVIAPAAQADEALLKKHNCVACHQIDKQTVGPAYRDVAKKYKGQKDAVAALSAKVKKGSQGVWGKIPMPPNPAVPDGDIKKMVEFILSR